MELGDEPGEPGEAEAGEGSDDRDPRQRGRSGGEAAVGLHLVGPAPGEDRAADEEQRTGDQAVGHHLQRGAGEGQRLGVFLSGDAGAGGCQSQHHVTHVVHAGVGDEPLEVGLGHRDE